MRTVRSLALVALVAAVAPVSAQEPAKPGPELEVLKKHVGTWDCTIKMGGAADSKGTSTAKLELGGLWVGSHFDGDFGGMKFEGRGMDTYDAAKKKYVATWCDSMSTTPLLMEGTFDAAKKTMTMTGDGPGPDGNPVKHKMVSVWKDDDHYDLMMFMGETKEPMLTIQYARKK